MRKRLIRIVAVTLFMMGASLPAQDVYQAMHEIVNYQREMETLYSLHEERYIDGNIIRDFLLSNGVTPDQIAKDPSLLGSSLGAWYSVDLGEVGGPGDYGHTEARKYLNPGKPKALNGSESVLRSSYDYLMNNRDYYLLHPPVLEMTYMRQGMNRWREHVLAYYEELRSYMKLFAEFKASNVKTGQAYWDKRKELEERYAERYEKSAVNKEFIAEMAALETDKITNTAKSEVLKAELKALKEEILKRRDVVIMDDLQTQFGNRIGFKEMNERYIVLAAKLKSGKLSGNEKLAAEAEMADLHRQLTEMAAALESKYGEHWKDLFRDARTARLPGGFLEDDSATKLKLFSNENYGTEYQIEGDDPNGTGVKPIDIFERDPILRGDAQTESANAEDEFTPPAESILDDVDQPEFTPPTESILDDVDQPELRTLTPRQVGQEVEKADREGLAESNPADWERDTSAAMTAVLSDARTPEEIAAAMEESRKFQMEMGASAEEIRAERELALAMQSARVAADEEVRRERLLMADDEELKRNRENALSDMQNYDRMLDERLSAEGRTELTPEEQEAYERRLSRYSALMEPTAKEEAELEKNQGVRDQVNTELNGLAAKMGGTSEEEKANREQNARMADAATRRWRDFTFAGKMASEMGEDIFHQRELGIEANNMVIAAKAYLERKDLTPEQRRAASQYLARAITARTHAAEAISRDTAVVLTGALADVVTLGAGGTISRGAARLFGSASGEVATQAATQAETQTATQVARADSSAAAAVAEDLTATQRLVNPTANEAANATTRIMPKKEAAAAVEDLTATQRLPNQAANEAANATTRIMPKKEAAAAVEDLTATQRLPNQAANEAANATTRIMPKKEAAAAVEDLTATQRLPNQAANEAANATTRIMPKKEAAAVVEDAVSTQASRPPVPSNPSVNAVPKPLSAAEEAALRAENLAREAEIRAAARAMNEGARREGQALINSGQEIDKLAAGKLASKVQGSNLQPSLDHALEGARRAGVPESVIRDCVGNAASHSIAPVAQRHDSILKLLEAAAAQNGTLMAREAARNTLQTVVRVQAGSAGKMEIEFLRAQIQEAAARGANYFDELATKGTVTQEGFLRVAGQEAIEALRKYAAANGL